MLLNVVEGQRRASQKDFLRFLDTADASLAEVEVCLEIAQDLQFISETNYVLLEEQRKEIAIMLTALIRTVKKSI